MRYGRGVTVGTTTVASVCILYAVPGFHRTVGEIILTEIKTQHKKWLKIVGGNCTAIKAFACQSIFVWMAQHVKSIKHNFDLYWFSGPMLYRLISHDKRREWCLREKKTSVRSAVTGGGTMTLKYVLDTTRVCLCIYSIGAQPYSSHMFIFVSLLCGKMNAFGKKCHTHRVRTHTHPLIHDMYIRNERN